MLLYTSIKYLHILLAIVAVGFNISYAIWLLRAAKEPTNLGFALRGIKFLDDRFANPAYGLLLVTGLAMVFVGSIPLTTFWILAALVLWLLAILLGLLFYTPTLRQQIAVLEKDGASSSEFQRLSQRGTLLGIVLAVIVLLILVMMVFKPGLS
ncbi:MAG TPA: DUF2269 family protein [Anaerolineae bacterium]|nr:DUF2269 family protein [Anaerolineae bacterium]